MMPRSLHATPSVRAPKAVLVMLAIVAASAACERAYARAGGQQSSTTVGEGAIARIRDEGLLRSQVMDTAFWLTDRYGPRLAGSPECEEAGLWAMDRLRGWGISAVHEERFRIGSGWSILRFHATMVTPRVMPVIAMPKAWSPGTRGLVSAGLVRADIGSAADAARYRGRLRGKIVLTQPPRAVRMLEYGDGAVLRYADQNGRWAREAMTPEPRDAEALPSAPPAPAFDVMQFYKQEGVVAVFDRGASTDLAPGGSNLSWQQQHVDGGTIILEERAAETVAHAPGVPQFTLAVEHYNRLARLVDHGVPVRVELNLQVAVRPETRPNGFNIIGEIPGTDKADEIVLLGAHFDSWHGGTGATDDAAGAAAMMEALRIIKAAGLAPRRTIRVGLWGSEESGQWNGLETGLVGSLTYVRDHLGTPAHPKPELARTVAYFNLDNGTGPVRGIWTQGNAEAARVFSGWTPAVADLGVDLISPRRVAQNDQVAFDLAGVPAFQFVQERYEYNARTHHTNMDVYDRLQENDVRQMATVAAVFAWQAATREDPLPRAAGQGR